MTDDRLTTGNERSDQLLQQMRSLGQGPAPAPRRELSRLLAGPRRPPQRRLWLVGGLSAVVIAGGAGTAAAAAGGLSHHWVGALGSISRLWADPPSSAGHRSSPTGTTLVRAGRVAGSGTAGAVASTQDVVLGHRDPTPKQPLAGRPAPGSGVTTRPAGSGDHPAGSDDPADTASGADTGDGHGGDGHDQTADQPDDQTDGVDHDAGGDAGDEASTGGDDGGSVDDAGGGSGDRSGGGD